ncbi:MAG TPA: MMPL family transporter [archaeon]|nr:MMPL family transporter [archaeon]
MSKMFANARVIIMLFFLITSLSLITFKGVNYGIDFQGGTLFQVQLEEKVSAAEMETVTSIISQRLDAFGLKDTKVNSLGDDLIAAQIAETNPEQIEELESLIKTQAKFEALIDGNILFEGSQIRQIFKDPARGYGAQQAGVGQYSWNLPFLLSQEAAENFSRKVFHRCTAVGFDSASGTQYDCDDTYFFIDRPSDSVILLPSGVYSADSQLLALGNIGENIPQGTTIDGLQGNSGLDFMLVSDSNFSDAQVQQLKALSSSKVKAIVHKTMPDKQRQQLGQLGFKVVEVREEDETVPWIWTATGARQVISLTPGIANLQPFVEDVRGAKIFSELSITGSSDTAESAAQELKSLQVLLETGSLPIGIKSVSKETISPLLGKEFLSNAMLIGLLGLAVVALIIFIRYRSIKLTVPIMFTSISEIIITLGVISLINYRLDLASVTGILAAVGTGVDDQIVIIDELKKGEENAAESLANRVKKAFFIIFAAAATVIATMLPLIVFSFGFGKLAGFGITTILGVLIGVFITRPAFSVFAEHVLKKA